MPSIFQIVSEETNHCCIILFNFLLTINPEWKNPTQNSGMSTSILKTSNADVYSLHLFCWHMVYSLRLLDWKSWATRRESAFFMRYTSILIRPSYFTIFQVESFFFSALAMIWHLIMDSPETFPWGFLHQKYLFREDSNGVFHHDSSSLWLSWLLNPELI